MAEPWALHPYQYVAQNQVAYWDPDGRDKWTIAGRAVQYLDTWADSKKLNTKQISDLRFIYGDSIDYSKVDLYSSNAWLGGRGRAFVVRYNVYLEGNTRIATLIHEIGHVWQYRHLGGGYASAAINAQDRIGSKGKGSAYNWGMLVHYTVPFTKWNPEAFAQFAEDIITSGLASPNSNGLTVAKSGASFGVDIPKDMEAYRDEKMSRTLFGPLFKEAPHLLYSGGWNRVTLSGKNFEGKINKYLDILQSGGYPTTNPKDNWEDKGKQVPGGNGREFLDLD